MLPELPKITPFTNFNMADLLCDRVRKYGDELFLAWEPPEGEARQWSYAEFAKAVERWAVGFKTAGLKKGDYVVIHLENCPEFIFAWHALTHMGCVPVTTNTRSVENEQQYFVEHSRAVAAITQSRFLSLFHQCTNLRWICSIDGGEADLPRDITMTPIEKICDALGAYEATPVSDQDVCSVQYTSGTTSRPKGVVWTHANALWGACVNATHMKLTSRDRTLVYFPLFHTNALCYSMLASLWAGAAIIVVPKFSATRFWPLSLKYECTWAPTIPFVINALAQQDDPVERHHYRFWGGVVCDPPGVEERWGVPVIGWYGMSETISHTMVGSLDISNTAMTVGRAATEYAVRVVDDAGRDVSGGETGRLLIKGTPGLSLFKEYLHNPTATAESYDDEGWFKTGDMVTLLEDGSIAFTEREKEVLKVGGENVSAKEIEQTILSLTEVREAAVVGVKHDFLDEVPLGMVIPKDGAAITSEQIQEHCRRRLADFKVPHEIRIVDELPRSLLNKIDKKAIRALLAEEKS